MNGDSSAIMGLKMELVWKVFVAASFAIAAKFSWAAWDSSQRQLMELTAIVRRLETTQAATTATLGAISSAVSHNNDRIDALQLRASGNGNGGR